MKHCYLLLLIIGFLTACDSTEYQLTPSVTGYPDRVGAKWTYDRQVIINKFESALSSVIVEADTLYSEVHVWVDKDTVLNKKTVKVYKSREGEGPVSEVRFMLFDKDSIINYAYQNAGLNVFVQKGLSLKVATSGKTFNDTIYFQASPILELKLPLLPDSTWTYKHATSSDRLRIDKVVSNKETMRLEGMIINCYKVDWIYSNDSIIDGAKTTEWLSEKGLMKRIISYDRISFTDEKKATLYEGQYTETLTLKSFRYK